MIVNKQNLKTQVSADLDVEILYNKIKKALELIKEIEIDAIKNLNNLSLEEISKLKNLESEEALNKIKEIRNKINLNKN